MATYDLDNYDDKNAAFRQHRDTLRKALESGISALRGSEASYPKSKFARNHLANKPAYDAHDLMNDIWVVRNAYPKVKSTLEKVLKPGHQNDKKWKVPQTETDCVSFHDMVAKLRNEIFGHLNTPEVYAITEHLRYGKTVLQDGVKAVRKQRGRKTSQTPESKPEADNDSDDEVGAQLLGHVKQEPGVESTDKSATAETDPPTAVEQNQEASESQVPDSRPTVKPQLSCPDKNSPSQAQENEIGDTTPQPEKRTMTLEEKLEFAKTKVDEWSDKYNKHLEDKKDVFYKAKEDPKIDYVEFPSVNPPLRPYGRYDFNMAIKKFVVEGQRLSPKHEAILLQDLTSFQDTPHRLQDMYDFSKRLTACLKHKKSQMLYAAKRTQWNDEISKLEKEIRDKKMAAEAKARAEAEAKAKAEAEAQAKADKERREKEQAEAEARAQADKEKREREQAEAEAKAKANKEKADREKAEREEALRQEAEKQRTDKERAERELALREEAYRQEAEKQKADNEKAEQERAAAIDEEIRDLFEEPPTTNGNVKGVRFDSPVGASVEYDNRDPVSELKRKATDDGDQSHKSQKTEPQTPTQQHDTVTPTPDMDSADVAPTSDKGNASASGLPGNAVPMPAAAPASTDNNNSSMTATPNGPSTIMVDLEEWQQMQRLFQAMKQKMGM